jgi:hypothetical protein
VFLVRLAVAFSISVAVGLVLPASDAVAAVVSAALFAAGCVVQRLVPIDVWSAIPRLGRS